MATNNKSKAKPRGARKKRVSRARQRGSGVFESVVNPLFRGIGRGLKRAFVDLAMRMNNGRGRVLVGVLLFFVMAVLFVSALSFVFTGANDQSIIQQGVDEGGADQASNLFSGWGAVLGDWLFQQLFGWGIFVLLGFGVYTAIYILWRSHRGGLNWLGQFVFASAATLWVSVLMAFVQRFLGNEGDTLWGGAHGRDVVLKAQGTIGNLGLLLTLVVSLLLALIFFSDKVLAAFREPKVPRGLSMPSLSGLRQGASSLVDATRQRIQRIDEEGEIEDDEDEPDESPVSESTASEVKVAAVSQPTPSPEPASEPVMSPTPVAKPVTKSGDLLIEQAPADDLVEVATRPANLLPGMQLVRYEQPSIDLLKAYEQGAKAQDYEEIEQNKQQIIETFASFKIPLSPERATVGPTVTLYEFVPGEGIRIKRIRDLEENISLGLKSEGGIRIIAPMPGKGTIGIEVPNTTPQTVSMRTILASRRFNDLRERMALPIGMGKTITNEPFVFDLAKMPHLLVAGATGQGKSVGLNAMIASLLYSKRPEELKFVLIDPKMLEFSCYTPIERHFMAKLPDAEEAIITDMSKVVPTLNSLCIEMDNRYKLLTQARVRNITEYNQQVCAGENRDLNKGELMPYIVLIVDEFADLIMTSGKEVEQPIARLAQKARAAGIHMIIATQRPSTDVITGLIKANFPARISFKVFSVTDSRVILDVPGANHLVGRGDMLFYQGQDLVRIQCAFLDMPEIEGVIDHICQQESPLAPYELPEYVPESGGEGKTFNPREKDSLFEEVAELIVTSGVGSTSNIQRKFNIGYNRAGRLMDQLEGAGIVGPQEGSKPREVYITDLVSLQALLDRLRNSD